MRYKFHSIKLYPALAGLILREVSKLFPFISHGFFRWMFSCMDYFFHVVQSSAGLAFPEVLSPRLQEFCSFWHLSLEIPTWKKAPNLRQPPECRKCLQGHRSCPGPGFVQSTVERGVLLIQGVICCNINNGVELPVICCELQ